MIDKSEGPPRVRHEKGEETAQADSAVSLRNEYLRRLPTRAPALEGLRNLDPNFGLKEKRYINAVSAREALARSENRPAPQDLDADSRKQAGDLVGLVNQFYKTLRAERDTPANSEAHSSHDSVASALNSFGQGLNASPSASKIIDAANAELQKQHIGVARNDFGEIWIGKKAQDPKDGYSADMRIYGTRNPF